MDFKNMIARCIHRMRARECATCDNRAVCPAGRWQQAFPAPPAEPRSPFLAFLSQFAGAIDRAVEPKSTLVRDVEACIVPLLATGNANIERVAAELGLSRQTLYRRLKNDGTTFEVLLDALRHRIALTLIRDQRLPVKHAAWRLGFSDPAAFSRAFKRWTGLAPSAA